jgi:hypothetical protein
MARPKATERESNMNDMYRKIKHVHIYKPTDMKERVPAAIRLYSTQFGSSWGMQVRGPMSIGGGYMTGKSDIIAHASLGVDDLLALRDAIDEALNETGRKQA